MRRSAASPRACRSGGSDEQASARHALLQEAGVSLDRALFPLLIVIERKGPVGVVELGELVGRDYTTVSRQVAKLDGLGLIRRHPSKIDQPRTRSRHHRQRQRMTSAIDAARERMAAVLLAKWSKRDLQDLARLMRRFVDDLQSLPPDRSYLWWASILGGPSVGGAVPAARPGFDAAHFGLDIRELGGCRIFFRRESGNLYSKEAIRSSSGGRGE